MRSLQCLWLLQPAGVDPGRIPPRLRQEELQPLHRRMLRPRHRLGPASAVSVFFRSRGASSPARYSRNPRHCASELNRSSNRAAYPSSGPSATGYGRHTGHIGERPPGYAETVVIRQSSVVHNCLPDWARGRLLRIHNCLFPLQTGDAMVDPPVPVPSTKSVEITAEAMAHCLG
jgi:hypothetical protein